MVSNGDLTNGPLSMVIDRDDHFWMPGTGHGLWWSLMVYEPYNWGYSIDLPGDTWGIVCPSPQQTMGRPCPGRSLVPGRSRLVFIDVYSKCRFNKYVKHAYRLNLTFFGYDMMSCFLVSFLAIIVMLMVKHGDNHIITPLGWSPKTKHGENDHVFPEICVVSGTVRNVN